MSEIYLHREGGSPLLLSIPHSGLEVPEEIAARLTPEARALPDTDWHVERLYDFADKLDATVVQARYSRYVIDLNRPPSGESLYPGQATTGLCPAVHFDGRPLYRDGSEIGEDEVAQRRETYWRPYHERLQAEMTRLRERHGHAILYDCHSIASRVPRLFEGTLPVLNLGTARGQSCAPALEKAAAEVMEASDFPAVVNGRFVGGYITRAYGKPAEGWHALQMELGQDAYLAEGPGYRYDEAKAARLKAVLRKVLEALLAADPH